MTTARTPVTAFEHTTAPVRVVFGPGRLSEVGRLRSHLGDDPGRALWELAARTGLPNDLASVGARREHLRAVAEEVAGTPHPVPADVDTVEDLLVHALRGDPPGTGPTSPTRTPSPGRTS